MGIQERGLPGKIILKVHLRELIERLRKREVSVYENRNESRINNCIILLFVNSCKISSVQTPYDS